jgi:hypothetical protein
MEILGDYGGSESNAKECQRRYDVSVVFTFIIGILCEAPCSRLNGTAAQLIQSIPSDAFKMGDFGV